MAALDKNCEFEIVRRAPETGPGQAPRKQWTVTIKIERSIRTIHKLSFEHGTLAVAILQAVNEAEARGWHRWT